MTDGDPEEDEEPDQEAIPVILETRPHRRTSMWRRVKRRRKRRREVNCMILSRVD
jgi:hypothetical protein